MASSTPRGISYPTSDDKIKDGSNPSALADDFAVLASSADAAMTAGVQEAKGAAAADASAKDVVIAAQASSAVSTAGLALNVAGGASSDADNAVDRVTALESAAGFGPSTPTDGTMANFIANPESLTATQLSTTIVQSVRPRAIDVREYASGSGAVDDTAALQAAIDAATTTDGSTRTVLVTPGVYPFRTLKMRQGVTLEGAGGTLKFADNTAISASTSYYPIENMAGAPNVGLLNLMVDANSANNPAYIVCDTVTVTGENQRVEGCTLVNNADSGIMFSKGKNSVVANNRISGGGDVGIYVNDGDGLGFYENVIQGNRITGFTHGGIALKRIVSRAVIAMNVIYDCGNGITLENASTATDFSTNLTIALNRVRGGQRGIDIRGAEHVIAQGNRLESIAGDGILITGSRASSIAGNIITHDEGATDNSLFFGIRVADREGRGSSELDISGNIVGRVNAATGLLTHAGAFRGLWLQGTAAAPNRGISLRGNKFAGTQLGGRVDVNNSGLKLTDNTFSGRDSFDMEWYFGASGTAMNNTLVKDSQSGAFRQVSTDARGWVRHYALTGAQRPDAAVAGEGAQVYIRDTRKHLTSDGTAWRDAMGVVVA